jgi:hypothetical protein
MNFNAITDQSIISYPCTPPELGPAGSTVIDPFCGNPMIRVTDENTDAGKPGASFTTPSSSETQPWACDTSAFVIGDLSGWNWLFQFTDFQAQLLRRLPSGVSNPVFSGQNRDLIWCIDGLSINQYNRTTEQIETVVDLMDYPELGIPDEPRWYLMSLSADWWDNRVAVCLGPAQDRNSLVCVWDEVRGLCWLDTQTGVYGGWASGRIEPWEPFLIHNLRMAKSGTAVRIAPVMDGNKMAFWQPGSLVFQLLTHSEQTPVLAHQALGFSTWYGNVSKSVPFQWIQAPLWNIPAWQNLMVPIPEPVPGWWSDSHISALADGADRSPLFISTENALENPITRGTPLTSDAAGDNEILALATDGSGRWWRLAHHYSTAVTSRDGTGNFYSTPRGNVSPNGEFFLFTSDWECTLGGDWPKQRVDVFVLRTGGPA